MLNGDELVIQIPGFTVAARQWGDKNGIPILAMHGWLDNASSFEFLAPLIKDAYIVAVDMPGCGHSSHRPLGTLPHIIDEVIYALQIANALGFKEFVVLGHSRGGAVAQLVAAACPERVRALILIEIVGFYTSEGENAAVRMRNAVKAVFGEQRGGTPFKDLKAAAEGRMLSSPIKYESALALARRGTTEVNGEVVWSFDRRERNIPSIIRYSDEQLNQILEAIVSPACVVLASRGIMGDEANAKLRAQKIRNAALFFLPGDHHLHMDDAAPVATIINNFLSKVKSG